MFNFTELVKPVHVLWLENHHSDWSLKCLYLTSQKRLDLCMQPWWDGSLGMLQKELLHHKLLLKQNRDDFFFYLSTFKLLPPKDKAARFMKSKITKTEPMPIALWLQHRDRLSKGSKGYEMWILAYYRIHIFPKKISW